MLVLLIFISIVQDAMWFVVNRDVEDDEDDGGVERGVKQFARKASYVSFAWRVSNPIKASLIFCHCQANIKCFLTPVLFCLFSADSGDRPLEDLVRLRESGKAQKCGRRGTQLRTACRDDH